MNSPQHFLAQLKKAQLRNKQNKPSIQARTKVITKATTMASTVTTNTTALTDQQYKNAILAKAITYIRGQV